MDEINKVCTPIICNFKLVITTIIFVWFSFLFREAIKKSLEEDQLFDEPPNPSSEEEKLKRAYISQKYMNQIVG